MRLVDADLLRTLALKAARAATGGNIQPWHIDIIHGDSIADPLKAIMRGKIERGETETPGYDIYPREMTDDARQRTFGIGEALYGALGIPREDKAARKAWFARNFQFFGAPAAYFCTVDRRMGPPQWADCGMYLQNLMLLAVEAEGWRRVRRNAGRCIPTRSNGDFSAHRLNACSSAESRSATRTRTKPRTHCARHVRRRRNG